MLVNALEVILIDDGTIKPPGPKMVICIEPTLGYFFRINTDPNWQTPVKIRQKDYPGFLHHDSHVECGEPLILDEYVIEESLRKRPKLGEVSHVVGKAMFEAAVKAKTITPADKEAIRKALKC